MWGPSPGFRELRWIRPVLAGDTISFSSVSRNQANIGEASRMGHPAGPQYRHQSARRTGVFVPVDGLRAATECGYLSPATNMVSGWPIGPGAIEDPLGRFFANAF